MSGESGPEPNRGYEKEKTWLDTWIDRNLEQSRTGNIDTGVSIGMRTLLVDFDSVILNLHGSARIDTGAGQAPPPVGDSPPFVSTGVRVMLTALMAYGLKAVFISARPQRQRDGTARTLIGLGFAEEELDLRMIPGSGLAGRRDFKQRIIADIAEELDVVFAFDNVEEDGDLYAAAGIDVCTMLPYSILKEK